MTTGNVEAISKWLLERAYGGASETELLDGFCERMNAAGFEISSGVAVVDTLHPIWEGRVFLWGNAGFIEGSMIEYESIKDGETAERWLNSPFYYLLQSGDDEVRRRIGPEYLGEFPIMEELMEYGHTEFYALVQRIPQEAVIGELDSIFTLWTTRHPGGFSDATSTALRHLNPVLCLALKTASLARITRTLAEVYLGKDAGQRVLEGRIRRGMTERIRAVLWFSDLTGFTSLTDAVAPDEIIPFLNDYAEVAITSVEASGGEVLKLIGDGVLAIFQGDDASTKALTAARTMKRANRELNLRRTSEGCPVTTINLGLHIGDVFYGNIGSNERLDFTVVGPAVNEVSRIVSMCRSADREVLASGAFVTTTPEPDHSAFASVGRYALRGVKKPQELFTIELEE